MKATTMQNLGNELLIRYELDDWTFVLDEGKLNRRGQMRLLDKEIAISKYYWQRKPDNEDWRNDLKATILHEIAHAQVGIDAGHGDEWLEAWKKLLRQHFNPRQVIFILACCPEVNVASPEGAGLP